FHRYRTNATAYTTEMQAITIMRCSWACSPVAIVAAESWWVRPIPTATADSARSASTNTTPAAHAHRSHVADDCADPCMIEPDTTPSLGHPPAPVACPAMRLLVARCEIAYHGRATTRLGAGDRVILFKDDGSLCVHTDYGFKPLNYMAGPTSVTEDGDVIRVHR